MGSFYELGYRSEKLVAAQWQEDDATANDHLAEAGELEWSDLRSLRSHFRGAATGRRKAQGCSSSVGFATNASSE
jgi:hypothetical protein